MKISEKEKKHESGKGKIEEEWVKDEEKIPLTCLLVNVEIAEEAVSAVCVATERESSVDGVRRCAVFGAGMHSNTVCTIHCNMNRLNKKKSTTQQKLKINETDANNEIGVNLR